MILEEIQNKLENELENEELTMEDIKDYELELDLEDLGHGEGLIDDIKFEIDTKDCIIRVKVGLY